MFNWVGATEIMVLIAILMSVSIIILEWRRRREWKHRNGWYRRGADGGNAKAHYFRFGGRYVPLVSFFRYYSLCGRTYRDPLGDWERILEPSPSIACTKCMDLLKKRSEPLPA